MAYSFHIPLGPRVLKIKNASALRRSERERRVPVMRIGRVYLVWWPRNGPRREHRLHLTGGGAA
jgi:hypothetical protein